MEQLKKTIDRANQSTIGRFEAHIPKPDLKYEEYLAIKNEFAPYQMRTKGSDIQLFIVSHLVLTVLGKILRRAKKL